MRKAPKSCTQRGDLGEQAAEEAANVVRICDVPERYARIKALAASTTNFEERR
jgi:hypothetical protein